MVGGGGGGEFKGRAAKVTGRWVRGERTGGLCRRRGVEGGSGLDGNGGSSLEGVLYSRYGYVCRALVAQTVARDSPAWADRRITGTRPADRPH